MKLTNLSFFSAVPIYILLVLLFFSFGCKQTTVEDQIINQTSSSFDSVLANKLGADQYGMKRYVIAFLMNGPNRDQDSATVAELQKAHLENIGRLANEGTLVLAGPFFGEDNMRGIYVFDVPTIAEAEALTNTDPAIQQGRLKMDLKPWYGSAALMQVNEIHTKIAKVKI